jgi:hypothetical protein
MSWQAYRLVFRLESPLHIGWRKPGNLMQTRYYIPGRVFWGAVTANLTRWLGGTDYRQVGEWVSDNLRFGYFFPADAPDNPLYPTYSQANITYGRDRNLTEAAFERRFLSSLASTAIAAEVFASQEGSLHEVEFIIPTLDTGKPVYLVGLLFVRMQTDNKASTTNNRMTVAIENDDIVIQGHSTCREIIASLRIGGERRYGFGQLTLCQNECKQENNLFGYPLNQENLYVTIPTQKPLLAHAVANSMNVEGSIEPLVSREWAQAEGPGRQVTLFGLCYTPGSVVINDTSFAIGHYGVWEQG